MSKAPPGFGRWTRVAATLERTRVRVGVLLAMLLAVGAIALVELTSRNGSARPATPAQVHLLSGWLARAHFPALIQVDESQTACLGGVLLCASGPEKPRALLARLAAALNAQGAAMGSVTCIHVAPKAAGWAVCNASGSYRNLEISLASGERRAYAQPSSWVSVDAAGVPYAQPKRLPLAQPAALAALGAFPAAWRLSLRCRREAAAGCLQYFAPVARRGSACAEAGIVLGELVASDFRIVGNAAGDGGRACGIDAAKALQPGGQDMIVVGWRLTDEPGGKSKGFVSIDSY